METTNCEKILNIVRLMIDVKLVLARVPLLKLGFLISLYLLLISFVGSCDVSGPNFIS